MFLYFLTSLIKLILWLKFLYRQKAGKDIGGGKGGGVRTIASCSVSVTLFQNALSKLINLLYIPQFPHP